MVAEVDRLGISGYYSAISWHCLLAGYGIFPERIEPRGRGHDMARIATLLAKSARHFAPHHEQLAALQG